MSGGTIANNGYSPFALRRNVEAGVTIGFYNTTGTLGFVGINAKGIPIFESPSSGINHIWHTGNLTNLSQLTDDVVSGKYLPLTGGAITGALDISTTNSIGLTLNRENADVGATMSIIFKKNGEFVNRILAKSENANLYRVDANDNRYAIWDSGNDGSGSGLDADLLDGLQPSELNVGSANLLSNTTKSINTDGDKNGVFYTRLNAANIGILPVEDNANGVLTINTSVANLHCHQLGFTNKGWFYRHVKNGTLSDSVNWKTIAFTDSNVASATKLETARTIWGQKFDGSESVRGNLVLNNDVFIVACDTNNEYSTVLGLNASNRLFIGSGTAKVGHSTSLCGHSITLNYGTSYTEGMQLTSTGNVLIGTTEDNGHKLNLLGSLRISNGIYMSNNEPLYQKDINGNDVRTIYTATTGRLMVGHGHATKGYTTSINGANIIFCYSSATTEGMRLNSLGNVLIGTTINSGYKLDVNGTLHISGVSTFDSSLSVKDSITSGDYCDWYGVSWSENDSDPTCTRIGNMAMHRSLPIQSAMKGYVINNTFNETSASGS